MAENKPANPETNAHHNHPDGRRCCGRLLSEKCGPEEESRNINQQTGEKSCCKGRHKHKPL